MSASSKCHSCQGLIIVNGFHLLHRSHLHQLLPAKKYTYSACQHCIWYTVLVRGSDIQSFTELTENQQVMDNLTGLIMVTISLELQKNSKVAGVTENRRSRLVPSYVSFPPGFPCHYCGGLHCLWADCQVRLETPTPVSWTAAGNGSPRSSVQSHWV